MLEYPAGVNTLLMIQKIELIRSQLRTASKIGGLALEDLALLDNIQTADLGTALEAIERVQLWLYTWQNTLEANVNESERLARR